MTDFTFEVDRDFALKHNEFHRDIRRMMASAWLLSGILIAIIAGAFALFHVTIWTIALAISLGTLAVINAIIAPMLPRIMGSPQDYCDRYDLAPAVIAEVNPRDVVVLALVDASSSEADRSLKDRLNGEGSGSHRATAGLRVPALAIRTVSSIPGVPRAVGERVPSFAVTSRRTTQSGDVFEEVSPMPVAWNTPDQQIWREAERAIPQNQWNRLEGLIDRLEDVKNTKRNLLILDEGKA